jgi:hypothetical protein
MPQYIQVNGETVEFPDNMSDTQIAAALKGNQSPVNTDLASQIPGQSYKAPAKQPEQPSFASSMFKKIDSAVRGMADTATFGLADELAAKADELRGKGTYAENLKQQRQRDAEGGLPMLAGQVAGAFMSPASGLISKGAQAIAPALKIAPEALSAAAQGAAYGAGSAEEGSRLQGAALGGVTGLGAGAATNIFGNTTEAFLRNQAAKKLPTAQQVRDVAGAVYDQANNLGVAIKPQPLLDSLNTLRSSLAKQGVTERSPLEANQKVLGLISQLEDSIGTQRLSWQQVEQLRQTASTMARDSLDPATKRLAGEVVGHLDETVSKLPTSAFVKGTAGNAEEAIKLTQQARDAWKQSRKADVLDELLNKAVTVGEKATGNEAKDIQQRLTTLINSRKFNMFTESEQNLIKAAQKSSSVDKIADLLSRFQAGASGRNLWISLGAATVAPMTTLGLQAAAYGAGAARSAVSQAEIANLAREIANKSPYKPQISQEALTQLGGGLGLFSVPNVYRGQ